MMKKDNGKEPLDNIQCKSDVEGKCTSPRISVITTSFNSAGTIEDTILSVVGQDYCAVEYIIVDGGSTDGTLDIIKKYGDRISRCISEPDRGIADAMNKGIMLASGEIIGIIHSDDYYMPGALRLVAEAFAAHPEAEVVHGVLRWLNAKGDALLERPGPDIRKAALKDMPVMHPTMFVRRGLYEKFGLFDLRYRVAMDYDLVLRFLENNVVFHYIDECLASMRLGGASNKDFSIRYKDLLDIQLRHGIGRARAYANYLHNTVYMMAERRLGLFLRRHGLDGIANLYRKLFYPNVPLDY